MKHNEELIFDFPEVTVLFCQICDFSKIVHHLSPQNVVRLLNIIFSQFDTIVDAHSVYKVETVAEVYMAVAGCPKMCKNHAELAAHTALAMQAAMPGIIEQLSTSIGFIGVEVSSPRFICDIFFSCNIESKIFSSSTPLDFEDPNRSQYWSHSVWCNW